MPAAAHAGQNHQHKTVLAGHLHYHGFLFREQSSITSKSFGFDLSREVVV
jgi:hypothetical protein